MRRTAAQVAFDEQVFAALWECGHATPTTLTLYVPRFPAGPVALPSEYNDVRMSLGRLVELRMVRHLRLEYWPLVAMMDMGQFEDLVR